jgi:membrane-associated phospholipid phosphatase
MGSWLQSLVPWGYSVIAWFQQAEHPVLTALFHGVTWLGSEWAYLLLLPVFYWCIDARLGRRLGVVVFLGLAVNLIIKAIFGIPRPVAGKIRTLAHEGTPSFPSGHAQGTLVLWGYVWTQWRHLAIRLSVPLLLLLVGVSRLYLGVHFPQDVLGGWLFGGLLLVLFVSLEPCVTPHLARTSDPLLVLVVLLASFTLLATMWIPGLFASAATLATSKKSLVSVCAAMAGFGLGLIAERKWVRFSSDGTAKQRCLRFLLGVVPVGLVFVGLKVVFPKDLLFRFVRYSMTGLAAACVAPWLFVRVGLAQKEES